MPIPIANTIPFKRTPQPVSYRCHRCGQSMHHPVSLASGQCISCRCPVTKPFTDEDYRVDCLPMNERRLIACLDILVTVINNQDLTITRKGEEKRLDGYLDGARSLIADITNGTNGH